MKKYLHLNFYLFVFVFLTTAGIAFSQQVIVTIKVNGIQGASKYYTVCKGSTINLQSKNSSLTPPSGGAVYEWLNIDSIGKPNSTDNKQSTNAQYGGRWVATIKYYNNSTSSWITGQDTVFISYYPFTPMQFLKGDGTPITSSNMTICGAGDSIVSVTPGFSNYKWYKDSKSSTVLSTTSSLVITQALLKAVDGNKPFLVEAEDANGCPVNNNININRDESVKVDLGNDINQCINSTVRLSSPISGTPGITRSFLWSTGETTKNYIDVTSGGTYWLRVTNKNASGLTCRFTDTIKIKENKDITLSITKDTTICYGSTVQLNVVASPAGTYTYDWNSNAELSSNTISNPVASPVGQGLHPYTVSVKDNSNCTNSKSVNVTVLAPTVNPYFTLSAGNDTSFCGGSTARLNPSISSAAYASTYTWSWSPATGLSNPSVKNPEVSLTNSGIQTYTLTATDARGCTKTATVNVNQYAPILVSPNFTDSTACIGHSMSIIVSPSGGSSSGYIYTFSPAPVSSSGNSAQVMITAAGSVVYQVSVEDNTGCSATEEVTVTGYVPQMYIANSEDTVAFKSSPQVPFILDAHTAPTNTVNWYHVGGTSIIGTGPTYGSVTDEVIYAQVTDPVNGCFNRDTVSITFIEGNPYVLFVPNAFSPKATKEENRSVKVYGTLIQENDFTFKIYNQWGQMVYNTSSFSEANNTGWNGDSGAQTNSVYTYTVKGKFYDGTEFNKTGTTTMLQ